MIFKKGSNRRMVGLVDDFRTFQRLGLTVEPEEPF
jgi:hypothetical protein